MNAERKALLALVYAIDSRWEGETQRRRDNALGPAIENALNSARVLVASDLPETINQRLRREFAELSARSAPERT